MELKKYLSYSEVCLLPEYSSVESRTICDTSFTDDVTGLSFKLPVMPANMKCCIDDNLAKWMSENEYFYSMHRFGDNYEFIKTSNDEKWKFISISIGVKKSDYELIDWIITNSMRVDCITIDIAHGHSTSMESMLKYTRDKMCDCLLIAGNVCTQKACSDLYEWGADMVKVGIAQGGACTTYGKTGFGTPMFTTVLECAKSGVPIIADGGIKTNGDIAKAIAAGAKMVMVGSMFAACVDAPGESIWSYKSVRDENSPFSLEKDSITHKVYFGSASEENKKSSGQKIKNIEGKKIHLECNGMTIQQKFEEIQQDLQSSISYAGGNSLKSLRNVKIVNI